MGLLDILTCIYVNNKRSIDVNQLDVYSSTVLRQLFIESYWVRQKWVKGKLLWYDYYYHTNNYKFEFHIYIVRIKVKIIPKYDTMFQNNNYKNTLLTYFCSGLIGLHFELLDIK